METIDDILRHYGVRSWKGTGDGLVAIRSGGLWQYFRWGNQTGYVLTGTTLKFGS